MSPAHLDVREEHAFRSYEGEPMSRLWRDGVGFFVFFILKRSSVSVPFSPFKLYARFSVGKVSLRRIVTSSKQVTWCVKLVICYLRWTFGESIC